METSIEPERKRPSLASRALARLQMRLARVTSVSLLSEDFRLIDFQGEALKGASWGPGDKVQVKLDGTLSTRTYTPITWDPATGKTQLLAYCHGNGPGSKWAKAAAVGDERYLFGPRSSLELGDIAAPIVLFGDETSFAFAAALEHRARSARPHFVFEVDDIEQSTSVAGKLGLTDAFLIQRNDADFHLGEASDTALAHAQSTTVFVLSGKASSIQRVRRRLQEAGIGRGRLYAKAYWAPGKVGLD